MRVTQKGQVTIPLEVRKALGIRPGSDVRFEVMATAPASGSASMTRGGRSPRMRGAGDVDLSTDEILALTRR